MKKYLAEFIGTFGLVFAGTGAIIINEEYNGVISHAGIAITFGLIVLAMIYTFGETSGAHFNPAVTIAFSIAGLFRVKEVFPYIISQITGAFFATTILLILFPENKNLGATIPAGSPLQSLILEFILSFFLMLVILNVSKGSRELGLLAGIAIGSTVLMEAMFAGPVSGASMNPARSLSPAIISGNTSTIWIYLVAPVTGTITGAFTWMFIKK